MPREAGVRDLAISAMTFVLGVPSPDYAICKLISRSGTLWPVCVQTPDCKRMRTARRDRHDNERIGDPSGGRGVSERTGCSAEAAGQSEPVHSGASGP